MLHQLTLASAAMAIVFSLMSVLDTRTACAVQLLYEGFAYPTTASTTSIPAAAGDKSLAGVVLSSPAAISLANGGGYYNSSPAILAAPNGVTGSAGLGNKWFPININAGGTTYNTAGDVDIVAGNLAYPGLATSTGNMIEAAGSGYSPRLNFPDVPSTGNVSESNGYNGSVFYSALVRINTMPGNADGDPIVSFAALDNLSTAATSAFFAGMFVKPNTATVEDTTDFLIGVSKGQSASGTFATYGTTPYHLGATLLVVGEWQFVANVDNAVREANDIARLYVNPTTLGGSAAGSGADVITDLGVSADDLPLGSRSIKGVAIHQRNATTPSFTIDEFRAGDTFADVTTPFTAASVDYNGNGIVDGADYVVWRNDPAAHGGDAGYLAWRAAYGTSPGGGSALGGSAVPEPGVAILLIGMLLPLCGRRGGSRGD